MRIPRTHNMQQEGQTPLRTCGLEHCDHYEQRMAVAKPLGLPVLGSYKKWGSLLSCLLMGVEGDYGPGGAMFCKPGRLGNLEARRSQYGHALGVLTDAGKETRVGMGWLLQAQLLKMMCPPASNPLCNSRGSADPSCHVLQAPSTPQIWSSHLPGREPHAGGEEVGLPWPCPPPRYYPGEGHRGECARLSISYTVSVCLWLVVL